MPADLRNRLIDRLGPFPLFQFWGPATTIASTRWIADATKLVMAANSPTLTLAYLPHLDYDLQRFGPDETHPAVRKSLSESLHDATSHRNALTSRVRMVLT